MARKRYTAEQIIGHLRQAEILISEGKTILEAARHLGVSEQRLRGVRGRREVDSTEGSESARWRSVSMGKVVRGGLASGHSDGVRLIQK